MWIIQSHDELPAIEELSGLDDRSAAIVAAALLDAKLDRYLRSALIQDADALDSMFKERGPLGSFGSRINLGYLLGVYSAEARNDLKQIAKIRNTFAHQTGIRSFTESPIRDHCANLSLIDRYLFDPNESEASGIAPGDHLSVGMYKARDVLRSPRERYTHTIALIHRGLQVADGRLTVGTPRL